MEDVLIREVIEILREATERKNWNTVKWMTEVLNMHTIGAIDEYLQIKKKAKEGGN